MCLTHGIYWRFRRFWNACCINCYEIKTRMSHLVNLIPFSCNSFLHQSDLIFVGSKKVTVLKICHSGEVYSSWYC